MNTDCEVFALDSPGYARAAQATRLNDQVRASTAEFIGIAGAEFSTAENFSLSASSLRLDPLVTSLRDHPSADFCLALPDDETHPVSLAWRSYPARLAALLYDLDFFPSILFRRSALVNHGGLKSVGRPLWDWIIRATQAGAQACFALHESDSLQIDAWHLPAPVLIPTPPSAEREWFRSHLQRFCTEAYRGNGPDAVALKAGLYQWHDYLTESHELSQSIEGRGPDQLGDYWHAIMHRREPDYSNAKYWFRRIGRQPTYEQLAAIADSLLKDAAEPGDAGKWHAKLLPRGEWNPFAFVDFCEDCEGGAAEVPKAFSELACRIQQVEMDLLFRASFGHAHGTLLTAGLPGL